MTSLSTLAIRRVLYCTLWSAIHRASWFIIAKWRSCPQQFKESLVAGQDIFAEAPLSWLPDEMSEAEPLLSYLEQ